MSAEIERQLFHLLAGTIFLLALHFWGVKQTLYFAVALGVFGFVLGQYVAHGGKISYVNKVLEKVERPHEKLGLRGKGALHFVAAVALLLALFPEKRIAFGALIVMAYGDSVATWVGRNFGKIKVTENRSVEGSAAGFLASFVMLSIFFPPFPALVAALVGMLAEYLPVNDSYSVPLASAAAFTLLL